MQQNLRELTGINPVEVIKGGSLGQGTAIPGDFDLDLVIYTDCKKHERNGNLVRDNCGPGPKIIAGGRTNLYNNLVQTNLVPRLKRT